MMQRFLCMVALVAVIPACSKSPPPIVLVSGIVTINGQPVPGAEVTFIPLIKGFDGNYMATAITDENGRYDLQVLGKPGACAASSVVTVAEGPLPDDARGQSAASQMRATRFMAALKNRPIPSQYTTAAQTPLKVEVKVGQTQYDLVLTR